ncbi:unnamed protein product [Eruca vesicaria subsp. sativa]|uniref:Xylulose kinase n=1 Tax=Eruca vesicaria subsp. sativa TaxID=29727 RepID=A0ABC8KEB3_ERUVS|nr:unnamed protein product [Eruca vesicaria subsp. sativa]
MADLSLPPDSLFLGFDSSTQSLKATVLDSSLNIVTTELVHFDSELPHYKTKDGVYRDPTVNGRIVSPTIMWVEALDLILHKLSSANFDFKKVIAVSGSGQQHGSVYWQKGSSQILTSLDPNKSLKDQLQNAFSFKESPIWMDSSTTVQCREIENAVGGGMVLSEITGSRAYERYTGPQIRKLFSTEGDLYERTERISLVSSFMASLLIGDYASIDETDGAGMNLMDIKKRCWSKEALEATATGLEEKLGKLAPAYATAGSISQYFVHRYGFEKNCVVVQWSGDNPNSLAGLTLSTPGDLAISLGTSDTVFGITKEHQPSLEGHVFPNPVDPGSYMVMLVYKNASLTREEIRDRCANGSWDVFNKYLEQTQPLNDGKLGFYYTENEILPPLPVGSHRYVLDNFSGESLEGVKEREVKEFDPPSEVRALIEGQFLSKRAHAERFGMPSPPIRIIATGGASANENILNLISAIFGCDVYTVQRPGNTCYIRTSCIFLAYSLIIGNLCVFLCTDSASLGAALRAAHGWLCNKKGTFVPISCLYEGKLEKTSLNCKLKVKAGDANVASNYGLLMKKRMEIEKKLVEKLGHF